MIRSIHFFRFFFAALLLLTPCSVEAQKFKASYLQHAYEKLELGADSINSQLITIRTDRAGVIEHIGFPLFSQKMRTLLPSPIYDYLEYAVLDHKYRLSENILQQQKIKFRNGTWEDLYHITSANDCTIDKVDNKWYIVTWNRPSAEPLAVAVPIDYELLANSTRKEMERNFVRNLKQFKPSKNASPVIEADELESLHRDGLLVKKGESFLIPEINSDTYYKLVTYQESGRVVISKFDKEEDITFEEDVPALLIDTNYPKETWANILLSPNHANISVDLSLEMLFVGYDKETVKTSLLQWLGYCKQAGYTPHYCYEGTAGNEGAAILIMLNQNEGHAHLVYLHADISRLEEKSQTFRGKTYLYIPTSNIQELFAKVAAGKSSPKTYE